MTTLLDSLVKLITMEPIDENVFRGQSQDLGLRQLFGGQILGQALAAASHTVSKNRPAHSIHGYFLRRGDPDYPVVFWVDRIRDGHSFTARRVTAIQNGQTIFVCSASFHTIEYGYQHQIPMPEVPPPETLESELELASNHKDQLPPEFYKRIKSGRPIDIRPVDGVNLFKAGVRPAIQHCWFKANGVVPNDEALHRSLLLYTTDFNLLRTSLLPHGRSILDPNIQVASIDHSLWFHAQPDMNDWLLFSIDSPWAGDARGFSKGSIFNRKGKLIASVCQEGLIRPMDMNV